MTQSDRRTFLSETAASMAAFALHARLGPPLPPPKSSEPLAVGLLGAGRQGRAILGELAKLEQVRVAAVADVVPGRLRSGLRRARGAKGHADPRGVLEDSDVRAVFVATPTHTHRELVEAALAAGKHVYCEAPLAHRVEDAHAIARAARGAETVVQAGFLARSNPIYRLARSFHLSGTLQRVIRIAAHDHRKTTWRAPAADPEVARALNWRLDPAVSPGLAGELGSHQLDVVHWFERRYPRAVRGGGAVRVHRDGRELFDTAHAEFDFGEGLVMSWDATLGCSVGGRHERLVGSMATIDLAWTAGWMFKEADSPTQGWEVYANRERFHDEEGITLIADATKLAEQGKLKEGVGLPHPPLYYALADFVRSVTEDKPVVCSAAEGMRATVVALLAERAIRSGERIEIPAEVLEVG